MVRDTCDPINRKAEFGSLRSARDTLQDPGQLELTGEMVSERKEPGRGRKREGDLKITKGEEEVCKKK